MPRGKSIRSLSEIEYGTIATGLMNTMDRELNADSAEARQRIIDEFPETMKAIERLAMGIAVQKPIATMTGLVCHQCGTAVDEMVYHIPPYWPALRWLADWQRQILKEAPKKEVTHTYPQEALDAMRIYVQSGGNGQSAPLALPEPNDDGVITLDDR